MLYSYHIIYNNKWVKIMTNKEVQSIFKCFNIDGHVVEISYFSNGLINTSCKITTVVDGKIKEYVLQKINKNVFKNPEQVMENISSVTNYIKQKIDSKGESSRRRVLKFYKSNNGKYYTVDENGEYWRMYKYVDHSIALNESNDTRVLEETGKAFGEFQQLLSDFPAKDLNIIIPHFHNTENRYKLFKDAVEKDKVNRVRNVKDEIFEYLNVEELATKMYKLQRAGDLQLRVTHNDTKCNNVLLDEVTKNYLCAIDLDTVMPGLVGFDFGDAIRFGASTASEDEVDLDKVALDVEKIEAFTKGFLSKTAHALTNKEIETLPLGAITMTLECGLRFLTDYLDGDNYFKIKYPEHNLDRARCQLALGLDMIRNYETMKQIVDNHYNIAIANKSEKVDNSEKQ